jgi:hypothetical protein
MATAVFPGPTRPVGVPSRRAQAIPSLSHGRKASQTGDLTIHRITRTHHGRTLLTLGHAAEYLANSGRYSSEKIDHASNVEAVHILMELSRSVFDEFAEGRTLSRRFEHWLIERAVGLFEDAAGKRVGEHRGNV